jgi:hypothetical protein
MSTIRPTGQYGKLDIINSAMRKVGMKTLDSLEGTYDIDKQAIREYEKVSLSTLKRYTTGFALKEMQLIQEDEWLVLPSDFLLDVQPKIKESTIKNGKRMVKLYGHGSILKYITDSPEERWFTPEYIDAVENELASIYALIFKGDPNLAAIFGAEARKCRLAIDALQPVDVIQKGVVYGRAY